MSGVPISASTHDLLFALFTNFAATFASTEHIDLFLARLCDNPTFPSLFVDSQSILVFAQIITKATPNGLSHVLGSFINNLASLPQFHSLSALAGLCCALPQQRSFDFLRKAVVRGEAIPTFTPELERNSRQEFHTLIASCSGGDCDGFVDLVSCPRYFPVLDIVCSARPDDPALPSLAIELSSRPRFPLLLQDLDGVMRFMRTTSKATSADQRLIFDRVVQNLEQLPWFHSFDNLSTFSRRLAENKFSFLKNVVVRGESIKEFLQEYDRNEQQFHDLLLSAFDVRIDKELFIDFVSRPKYFPILAKFMTQCSGSPILDSLALDISRKPSFPHLVNDTDGITCFAKALIKATERNQQEILDVISGALDRLPWFWSVANRACSLDTDVFQALLEQKRLFPFVRKRCDVAVQGTVFCLVYQCAPGSGTRVKVEICALLGDCVM
jgi:hypothetical protein